MHACGDSGELGDERTGHRNIRLGAVDRISPVHDDGSGVEHCLAALPILRPHVHAEWWACLFRVSDHMNFMAALREAVGSPVGPHADAALYRRKLPDNADSHLRTWRSPCCARSLMSPSRSAVVPSVAGSVQSLRAV